MVHSDKSVDDVPGALPYSYKVCDDNVWFLVDCLQRLQPVSHQGVALAGHGRVQV